MNNTKDEFFGTGSFSFRESISYSDNAIVSKQVIKKPAGNITLFAFDKGQELSEHTAPFDALVQVLEGKVRIMIDKKEHQLEKDSSVIMPANIPHAVYATERFKMLLIMIKV
jgi:quercetin dioxygenase-like cupin family protein